MLEKYDEDIAKIKENLNILPHKKKADKEKYSQYILDELKKYTDLQSALKKEIEFRYNKYLKKEENKSINELKNNEIDYSFINYTNKYSDSFVKMGLDVSLYKLKHFYKDHLNDVNEVIKDIINEFKIANVELKLEDFNYSNHVNEYMKIIFSNKQDEKDIYQTFEKIYWECPMVINHIRNNIYYLFYKNKKNIDKYFSEKSKDLDINNLVLTRRNNIVKLDELIHNDYRYILNRFIDGELIPNDFSDVTIDKLKNRILNDVDNDNNYSNLLKLYTSLIEYKSYLEYKIIVDDVKELYKNKVTYQNSVLNKLKEINKEESNLFNYNKKLNKTGIFKLKESKKRDISLKIDECLDNLIKLYNDFEDLRVGNNIFEFLKDDSSLTELLDVSSFCYKYLHGLFLAQNSNLSIDDVVNKVNELKMYLIDNNLNIISNIKIIQDSDIVMNIVDHYSLLKINITYEDINENIDNLIKSIDTLITFYDMKKLNINIDMINFVLQVNKSNILK